MNSARVSFGQHKEELDERDKKLINYLIKHRHTSTLEHCGITFKFVVPLYIRSQHHRHRTWSYNEISRRYTDVDLRFYEPKAFRTQHKSNRQASNAEELIDPEITTSVFNEDGSKWEGFFIDQEVKSTNLVKEHHEQSLSRSTSSSKLAFAESKLVEFYHRTFTLNTTAQSIFQTF